MKNNLDRGTALPDQGLHFCNQALHSKRGETAATPKILLPFLKGTTEKPITATI
ncbi:unnamed protein product [Camellia sinensis]